jgi:hypothetical protein
MPRLWKSWKTSFAETIRRSPQQTFRRLIAAGHSEEETKRLIACALPAEIFDILKQQKPFDLDRFVKALVKLPAMPWDDEED